MDIGEVRKRILVFDFFLFSKHDNAEGREPTKFEDESTEEKMIDSKSLRMDKRPSLKKEGPERRGQTEEIQAELDNSLSQVDGYV